MDTIHSGVVVLHGGSHAASLVKDVLAAGSYNIRYVLHGSVMGGVGSRAAFLV